MKPEQLVILKTELTADPIGRGYAAMLLEDGAPSHEKMSKTFAIVDRTVRRDNVTGGEIRAAFSRAEWVALSSDDRSYLTFLTTSGDLPLTTELKAELSTLVPPTKFFSLTTRLGNRAEEIGVPIPTPSDVADALRS
jgi:hypothetical protein